MRFGMEVGEPELTVQFWPRQRASRRSAEDPYFALHARFNDCRNLLFTTSLPPAANAIAAREGNRERARRGRYPVCTEAGDRRQRNKPLTSKRAVSINGG